MAVSHLTYLVKDCARSNILAMSSDIKKGFYNVGTGASLLNLAETLYDLVGKKIKFKKISIVHSLKIELDHKKS